MAEWFTGVCVGGPLDGERVTVRSSAFLATDRAAGMAWVYQHDGDRFVLSTDHDNSLVYPQGTSTGERRIDWERLPFSAGPLDEVRLGDGEERESGDPVDDGWAA